METGKSFGKYDILKLIGSGATSDVYLAKDTRLERKVALKILKPALVADQQGFARFTKEAQIAGKLFHDHIATVFDMGEEDGHYFIAMQYIEGISLAEHLKQKGPMNWRNIQKLATQVGSALSYAHQEGFLHRDIKPNNIMVSEKGDFVLTDFGLTRAMFQTGMLTTTGAILGTPPYIPPEVWNGSPAEEASDQYSLACVIDEAITGSPRFMGETPQAVITKHLIEGPKCDNFPGDVPENIRFIIQKALSKLPADRFSTINEFVYTIQIPDKFDKKSYLTKSSSSIADVKDGKPKQKSRFVKVLVGLVVVLGILCVAVGFLVVQFNLFNFRTIIGLSNPTPTLQGIISDSPDEEAAVSAIEAEGVADVEDQVVNPSTITATSAPSETESAIAEPTQASSPTFTPEPTQTLTAVPTPTVAGQLETLVGSGVTVTQVDYEGADLVFYVYRGDGSPVENLYVKVFTQKQDLSGHWVTDDDVDDRRTDNSGKAAFSLSPGSYIIYTKLGGYNWGTAWDTPGQANVEVVSGKTTQVVLRLNRFYLGIVKADGSVWDNKYVQVFTQKENLSGDLVTFNEVADGRTDNSGVVVFNLTPGYYITEVNFAGYNWGSAYDVMGQANIPLKAGEEYHLTIKLCQIVVGLKDTAGKPITSEYVEVHTQTKDVSGNPTSDNRVGDGRTGNTGSITFNLTPGLYSVYFDKVHHYNIECQAGKITLTDGVNQQIQE